MQRHLLRRWLHARVPLVWEASQRENESGRELTNAGGCVALHVDARIAHLPSAVTLLATVPCPRRPLRSGKTPAPSWSLLRATWMWPYSFVDSCQNVLRAGRSQKAGPHFR